jgi:hypothetical protein
MSIVGFIILVVLVLIGLWIFVELAKLPGQKAMERSHPQAEAINVLGWVGLLFGGIPWLIALVWAYVNPPMSQSSPAAPLVKEGEAGGD